ncbi:MAG: copper amine oxidase N-terminal domain-containing protein [Firmicutes bacterium]|nr:copper amine oxidase N-terminal domain-containing protein [Bacillota bacterium]
MKKSLMKASALILAGAMSFGAMSSMALADSGINVKVNGNSVSFPDAKPFIDENSRTLVPLRPIGEALGMIVTWDADNRVAIFEKNFQSVAFFIDKNVYEIATGKEVKHEEMDTAAVISEDRTYAPARYLAEAFGYEVGWDNDTRTVTITGDSGEMPVIPDNPAPSNDMTGEKLLALLADPFDFSSGAGGWGTELKIHPDGSFDCTFHDSEMGSTGPGYPHGSMYVAVCSGHFSIPKKVNDYTYSMELLDIEYENEIDKEEIMDEIKFIYTTAYGLDGGKTFHIYTPDAPVSQLPEEFKSWVYDLRVNPDQEKLGFYGINNLVENYGFTSSNGVEAVG